MPGIEFYGKRLVRALARGLQVSLLVFDSSVLAPFDFGEEYATKSDSEDGNVESGEGCTSESEEKEENDVGNEEECVSSSEAKSNESNDDDSVDVQASSEALKKLLPRSLEEFTKNISGEIGSTTSAESDASSEEPKRPLKKGVHVKYIGAWVIVGVYACVCLYACLKTSSYSSGRDEMKFSCGVARHRLLRSSGCTK